MRVPSFAVAANAVVIAGSLVAAAAVSAACSPAAVNGPSNNVAEGSVDIPREVKLLNVPESEPEELPGVETSGLNPRERKLFWQWVSQLYAPCPEVAVSVATCVKEARACAACGPAARFLLGRAVDGADRSEAMAAHAVPYLDALVEKLPDDVRLVHKLYPLRTHSHARAAARAALAAKKQGKYWALEALLFKNQKKLEDADLEEHAAKAGLDMKRFRKDFADEKAAEAIIDRDKAEADKHGLTGTPFILINGREFDLGLFRLDRDLAGWVAAEIEMRKKEPAATAAGAAGAPGAAEPVQTP
jgi:hypothetical protein